MQKIPVINPEGQFGTIDADQLQGALGAGYRQPTAQEIQAAEARKVAGEQPILAGTEAALSTATFGLSREAANALGITTPEAQKLRQEENPVASEIVGPAVGIAGSLLLGPEAGAAKMATTGAEAAAGGASALGKYLPVNVASKVGQAVSEKAAPAIGKGVSIIANPETRPIANKILQNAGSAAFGSAVEGSLYGLGQAVDEHALGDPNALGEKLIANVGFGAVLGGGLGALLGGGKGALEGLTKTRKMGTTMLPSEAQKVAGGDIESAVLASDIPEAEKAGILDKLKDLADVKKLSKDAQEIKDIGGKYGLDVTAGQISENPTVQFADDFLKNSKSPSVAANSYAMKAQENFKKAADIVTNAVGADAERMTEFEVANKLSDTLSSKMSAEHKASADLFKDVADTLKVMPVEKKEIESTVKAIFESPEVMKRGELSGAKLLKKSARMLEKAETVEDLEALRKSIFGELSAIENPNTRKAAGDIYWKLDDMVEKHLERHGKTIGGAEGNALLAKIEARRAAKAEFREFMEKYQPILEELGGSNIRTAPEMIKFIKEMNPQKLANRLFQKGNIKFTQEVQEKFPDIFNIIRDHEVGKSIQAARKHSKSGEFNPISFLKEYRNTPEELKNLKFAKEQRETLDEMVKWFGSYKDKFNPSASGYVKAGEEALKSVSGFAMANARDSIMKGLVDYAIKTGDLEAAQSQLALRGIERHSQDISQKINKGLKLLVSTAKGTGFVESIKHNEIKPEERADLVAKVQRYNADPMAFMDEISNQTEGLYAVAPNITQSAQATIAKINSVLASKIPAAPQSGPLSKPYEPSRAEMAKFERAYIAATNPLTIINQALNGTITPDALDTVRQVYPSLMQEIQMRAIEEMGSKHHELHNLPMKKKMGLSALLGQDLFNGLSQQNLLSNQSSLLAPGSQQAMNEAKSSIKINQSGMSKVTLAERMATDTAHTENRKLS